MDGIRQYILTVTAAAVLCAVVRTLFPEQSPGGKLIRLVCGIFLCFVVISPISTVNLAALPEVIDTWTVSGQEAAAAGEKLAEESTRRFIKEQTEAYILDKAGALGANITVTVTLGEGSLPAPGSVRISGPVSPYARRELEALLEQELGISKENQLWIG